MISSSEIAGLRQASIDYGESTGLKTKFAKLRGERQPLFLKAKEFDEILVWKLRQQYGRSAVIRGSNTDDVIRAVTKLALDIAHEDEDYELELRMKALCILRGVGVPVASAVLALVYPEKYAVVDFRGWRQIFGEQKRNFSIADYKRYLTRVRGLADELDWLPQEVDLAIWEYDRRCGKQAEPHMSKVATKTPVRLTGKKIGKSAIGKVRGLSTHYVDGLERIEIWINKKVAGSLPCQDNLRLPVQLIIGDQVYTAGIRSTPKNLYVWICPDLEDNSGKKARLAEVLGANRFEKNQEVLLEVEERSIYLSHLV